MSIAPTPAGEAKRLEILHRYAVLDTLPEQNFDDITYLASCICDTPIALISLVDAERQWFKSKVGLEASETPRDIAFCSHAILNPEELLVVPDAAEDRRFSENPLVTQGPRIRFYAGAPLATAEGHALGTLCVIDRRPRELTAEQKIALSALSRQVISQLELRIAVTGLKQQAEELLGHQADLERYQKRLEDANAALETMSMTDSLTGVANRAAMSQRLEEEWHRAQRHGNPLALVVMDVDHFKSFNDEYGHPEGDELLRIVARLLQENSRSCDFLFRYGGEEFVAVVPNTDLNGVGILAQRYRKAIESFKWPKREITISLGAAVLQDCETSAETLLARADQALYRAKDEGRNRVVVAGKP